MKGFVLIKIVARFKLNQVVEFVHLIDSLVLFLCILCCNVHDCCDSVSHEFILFGVQANLLNFM